MKSLFRSIRQQMRADVHRTIGTFIILCALVLPRLASSLTGAVIGYFAPIIFGVIYAECGNKFWHSLRQWKARRRNIKNARTWFFFKTWEATEKAILGKQNPYCYTIKFWRDMEKSILAETRTRFNLPDFNP